MGSVHEQRLEEIWFSEPFEAYRRRLHSQGRAGLILCEQCTWRGDGHRRDYP